MAKAKAQPGDDKLRKLPDDSDRWNKAHRGAFLKGQRAQLSGTSFDDCPYEDHRKMDGKLTWSRAFWACWRDGWRWQKQGEPK